MSKEMVLVQILILFFIFLSVLSLYYPLLGIHKKLVKEEKFDKTFEEKAVLERKIQDLELDKETGKITEEEWKHLTSQIFKKIQLIESKIRNESHS